MDFDSPKPTKKYTQPEFLDRSAELIRVMRTKTPDQISDLMHISPELAALNFERYQDWEPPFTPKNARPAVLAFAGDTYIGMDAKATFNERDYTQAQKVLRILSGLYGVLRPLDLIQPYRLEMGVKLRTEKGRDLYDFWGNAITDNLNAALAGSPGADALVNLASIEYATVIQQNRLAGQLITPHFLDAKAGGAPKVVSFFAKRARGAMAGWIIRERIKSVRALRQFDGLGYAFDAGRSTTANPVFIRVAS